MLQIRRREKDFLLRGREEYVDSVRILTATFREELFSIMLSTNQQQRLLILINRYEILFAEVADIHKRVQQLDLEISESLLPAFMLLGNEMSGFLVKDIQREAQFDLSRAKVAAARNYDNILLQTVFLVLAGTMIGLAVGLVTRRSVTSPVEALVQATQRITEGDFSSRVHVHNDDELGQLGTSFNRMTDALVAHIDELSDAQRELQQQAQTLDERLRDLHCVHSVAGIAEQDELSLSERLQAIVEEIPKAWADTAEFGVRLVVDQQRFHTNSVGVVLYSSPISVKAQDIGSLAVIRPADTPTGAWTSSSMMDVIAERIGAMIESVRSRDENEILEGKLQRSQKMEAIGTLSGGVAHDLNNILAGLVTYPELMLMELPPDSKMRKPLTTMQKAGEKAAAIVQDMLTLSRRGVNVSEVTNLNQVVREYLTSPEYQKMMSFHPRVNLETNLCEQDLLMSGSPVHLSKTIMNLIGNAAEAMPDGGLITVSTMTTYVQRTITSYEPIAEGDYVVVTISDSGVGISEEDQERIFEPFFTKKVMGRSGTGLGMAVVWGTVKDHGGYLDLISSEGVGTTFKLYFPTTEESLQAAPVPRSLKEYRGHGERILVVDDVSEQRMVCTSILDQLGYEVTAVESGEAAIAHMSEDHADLVILDMIMDPGIDGLETYRQILNRHPDQKAIITSGFSETDRVKEAQALGAGPYVKKPYGIETIGIAIRDALENRPTDPVVNA
ncbi:MAG: ATP-binding protein, partial [Pseudomonadota bacterium]